MRSESQMYLKCLDPCMMRIRGGGVIPVAGCGRKAAMFIDA